MIRFSLRLLATWAASLGPVVPPLRAQAPAPHVFEPGDRVCLVGNSLAERIQFDGWLEARLQARLPELGLVFRNLGFAADELSVQQRTAGFGSLDEHLERCRASVVLAFFGYVESFRGASGLAQYKADLAGFVDHVRAQRYDGTRAPRVVLFTPQACQDLRDPHLPEAKAENARLVAYALATAEVAREKGVLFVDLFASMLDRYASEPPLTIDGAHLNERGNAVLAEVIEAALLPGRAPDGLAQRIAALRPLVVEKDRRWRDRYHTTDGYNVYGGRSSLEYDGLTNFTVMQRELDVLAKMAENLDRRIHALARGESPPADEPLPEEIPVPTNKPGPNPDGTYPFLSGEEAIAKMTPGKGLSIALFADERHFPELANPVQMSFDAHGRLWVACWPSYPHWKPGTPRADKLVVLEDRDGDGRADRSAVFAGDLHNPTGFEFWNGGVLLAAAPDLVFLQDTDGDGRADRREVLLSGLSSADTHHTANSFVIGPDGALYFQEGVFHQTQIESVRGPVRNHDACVWRYEPRTRVVERYSPYPYLNPHGHVFDRWGQDFVTDGTGNENFYALPITARVPEPRKLPPTGPFFPQRSRPAAATEILSSGHFPSDFEQNYLVANVIGFQGVFRYRLEDAGSGFGARELEPIVHSSDPSFRPVDLETGPDGALYFLDWHNPLIGHMQHHLRDPSRDHVHGRVYRVTAVGEPLSPRAKIAGEPIAKLLELLKSEEDRVRYRARIELGARRADEVVAAARAWAAALDPDDPDSDHHRLEALWAQAQHAVLDADLLEALLGSAEPRARAEAMRILRHWRDQEPDALAIVSRCTRDVHPRVRLEALVALGYFDDRQAVESALAVLEQPMDRFLEYALARTLEALEPVWRSALLSGEPFLEDDPAGVARLVARLSTEELARVFPGAPVHEELLARHGVGTAEVLGALRALAERRDSSAAAELLRAIERLDQRGGEHADHALAGLFAVVGELQPAQRGALAVPLKSLAASGVRPATRKLAAVARLRADGSVEGAWNEAARSAGALADLLDALPLLDDPVLGRELFPRVEGLLERAPGGLSAEARAARTRGRYVRIELPGGGRTLTLAEVEVFSGGKNVAPHGRATQSSTAWSGAAERAVDGNASGSFASGGQTHTTEGASDPWWELDLGAENTVERIVVWNRDEEQGRFASRLDGYVLRVLDGERRAVFERKTARAGARSDVFELASPLARVRASAARALVALGVEEEAAVRALLARFDDPEIEGAVVAALRSVPQARWPVGSQEALAKRLLATFAARPEAEFDGEAGRELLAFADELFPALPADLAAQLRRARRRLGPQVVVIRPVPDSLTYDRREFTVAAGRPVEIVFSNIDIMPHNLVITAPGALARVGLAAEAMSADPGAAAKHWVPELAEVLHATRLVAPGETQTLRFTAPLATGDHPFVCTFPGHWVRMNGVMHVVATPDEVGETAEPAPAVAGPARRFVRAWTLADLAGDVRLGARGSAERGRRVAEEASCLRCHPIDGEGGRTGPELGEVVTRYDDAGLLAEMLEPSRSILAGYGAETFVTRDERVLSGRVLAEDAESVTVQADPYAPEGTRLAKAEIESRRAAAVSIMPEGLLSTFERGEILDLIVYLRSLAKRAGK